MRKVRSAPQLAAMDAAAAMPASITASSRHPPPGSSSYGTFAQAPRKKGPAAGGPLHRLGSMSGLQRSSSPVHRLSAFILDAPSPPPSTGTASDLMAEAVEQADELIEEFVWARGLIPAGECFEQFGWTESAPQLTDIRQPATEDQRKALASCLATPFMYDNEHLSKKAQESVNKRSQQNNRLLTNRFIEEVTGQQSEDNERDACSYAGQQSMARSRRRRRSNHASFADQILSSAPPLTGRSTSPNTQRRLSHTLSSLEDDRNKLHLHESTLAEKKNMAHVDSSIDPATISMEAPDQALFSMDDPARITHAKHAPGGGMAVARHDNILSVKQQDNPVTAERPPLHDTTLAIGDNSHNISATNDHSGDCTTDYIRMSGKKYGEDQEAATPAESDENDTEQVQPKQVAKERCTNNIVPFLKPKVFRSQN